MSLDSYLKELFDPSKKIVVSKLLNLSGIWAEELEEFEREWLHAATDRRRQIARTMVEIAEDSVEADFERLFRFCLGDVDPEVRSTGIDGLWECNSRWLMLRLLTMQSDDPSLEVRAAATSALEKFCTMAELGELRPGDAEKLQDRLFYLIEKDDGDIAVRRRALEAVSPFSGPKVDELIRWAYHEGGPDLKLGAVYAMGRHCDKGWVPVLLSELRNNDPTMRYEAARACGQLEEERSVPQLSQLVDDEDPQVQQASIQALGFIGGDQAKEVLRKCLSSPDTKIQEGRGGAGIHPRFQSSSFFLIAPLAVK